MTFDPKDLDVLTSQAAERIKTVLDGTSLTVLDEVRRQSDAIALMTTNVARFNEPTVQAAEGIRQLPAAVDVDSMIGKQVAAVQKILESPAIVRQHEYMLTQLEALRPHIEILSQHEKLFAAAQEIAATAAPWGEMISRISTDFSKLIPESAFNEAHRIAESVRLSMPTIPAFDAGLFTTNWDATLSAAVEQFRQRAQDIATDPHADFEDVQALIAQAHANAAAAPPEARAALKVYNERLLFWVLGVLMENPVRAAAGRLLATLMIFFSSLQPVVLPEPPPPPAALLAPRTIEPVPKPDDRGALALPGEWQIEGLPDVIKRAGPKAAMRTLEFFTANIRNPNTRQAYAHATMRFFNWCNDRNLELADITPFAVAAYIEELQREASAPTVKQHLAAIRMLFDWLVVGQVLPMNPAASVRGPQHIVKRGKTPVLTADQARTLLDAIDTERIDGLRDRALIGVMVYSFARVSAAVRMNVEDYYPSGKRWWLRLNEKGGKQHDVPAHHSAEAYLDAYLDAAGIAGEASEPLFRTLGRDRKLTDAAMTRTDALRMIKRRAIAAGLPPSTCCHTFRATGITAYLSNGGTIEKAQQIAAHESIRTTKLYDRTSDELTLDEIEKIII